jgi:hypothetical protein
MAGSKTALFTAAIVAATTVARAMPKPGEIFPSLAANDLTGQSRATDAYDGARTLVVSITDKNAGGAMRAWFQAADANVPATVARRSIISLHLPFVVTTDYARRRAREEVPQAYWHDTLLDRGSMADKLEQPESIVPYVYALDEHRRVLASFHGTADAADAQQIWKALAVGPRDLPSH